nr:hypothetical protein B0A51_00066 [Rachicladosporium sp. CCFEE 5018]
MNSYQSCFPANLSAYQAIHQNRYATPYQQAAPYHHPTQLQFLPNKSQYQYPSQYSQVDAYSGTSSTARIRGPATAPGDPSVRTALMNAQENATVPQHINDLCLGIPTQQRNNSKPKRSQSASSGSSADTEFDDSQSTSSGGSTNAVPEGLEQSSLVATGIALPARVDRQMSNQGEPTKRFTGSGTLQTSAEWENLERMWGLYLSRHSAESLLRILATFESDIRQIDETCAKIGRMPGALNAPTTPRTSINETGTEVSETAPLRLGLAVAEVLRTLTSILNESDAVLRETVE